MLRWLLLVIGLLSIPVWAADDIDEEIRQAESVLARIAQEQQSVYQQFQMVQTLLSGEERQMLPIPTAPRTTAPIYEDVTREANLRAARVKQYQDEPNRLYTRYRELAEHKRQPLETLSALTQERSRQRYCRSLPEAERGAACPPF